MPDLTDNLLGSMTNPGLQPRKPHERKVKLADFKDGPNKMNRKILKDLTHEEKLALVDEIIDRDAQFWKDRARWSCDFGYYFRTLDGGIALTERQR